MRKFLIAVMAFALSTGLAFAAGDHGKGPMGGIVEENGPLHVELVQSPADVKLFIYDGRMKSLSTSGATAKATVLAGSKQDQVPLESAQPNGFVGKYALASGARLVVEVTMPGKRPVMVRFSVK